METQAYTQRDIVARLNTHLQRFGYEATEAPIIDFADLFLLKAGDQVISRLFTFERYGQQLALRPEFTALAANTYARRFNDTMPLVRWRYDGAVFEDDPHQADGQYQHASVGAEMIGTGTPWADAEIIGMAASAIADLPVDGWTLRIGHVGVLREAMARYELDSRTERFLLHHIPLLCEQGQDAVLDKLDRQIIGSHFSDDMTPNADGIQTTTQRILDAVLDANQAGATMGGRSREDIVRRLLDKRRRASERDQILAALDFLAAWCDASGPVDEALDAIASLVPQNTHRTWRQTMQLVTAYGVPTESIYIDTTLARGWEYYTGVVFEVVTGDRVICGGGRYDEMVHLFGHKDRVPAVGCAFFVDALLEQLSAGVPPRRTLLSLSSANGAEMHAAQWATRLRQHGHSVAMVDAGGDLHAKTNGTIVYMAQTFETLETLIEKLGADRG